MEISSFFSGKLTLDQKHALDKLVFFFSTNTNCFLLKGYAGTGKTFLMEGIVKYLISTGINFRLMAPTGRAAMVIGNKTKREATTIHKAIYNLNYLEDDETTFKLYYKLNSNDDSITTIYIIDEASMISNVHSEDEFFVFGTGYLLNDLFKFVNIKDRIKAKIIFIGDNAQLPPVGMNFSPALDVNYIQEHFNVTCESIELKEVVRQKAESNILTVATQIRNSIESESYNRFELPKSKSDIQFISPSTFLNSYLSVVKNIIDENTVIITHSNRQALDYNINIREYFFKDSEICPNDILILTKNNYNYPIELYNGMFIRVIEKSSFTESKYTTFYLKGGKKITISQRFRDVVVAAKSFSGDVYTIKCKIIDDFLTAENGRLHPYEQRALYIDFKNRHPYLKPRTPEFRTALISDPYFNALQAKYGYAITCHKSQGGEWEKVFVDFKVFIGTLTKGFFRWAYTAITRSSKLLYAIDAKNYSPLTEFIVKPIEKLSKPLTGAYYVPEVEITKNDDLLFMQFPFLKIKNYEVLAAINDQDLKIKLIHNKWVERYTFQRDEHIVVIDLNYSAKGFTGNYNIITSNDLELLEFIKIICLTKQVYEFVYEPSNKFQLDLYDYIKEVLSELSISLTNIKNETNCDKYFIKTDAECALIEFWYEKTGIYSKAFPKSTLGTDDIILANVISNFK